MEQLSKESRLNLALQALQKDPKLSLRAASKVYSISYTTLNSRHHGRRARTDISANSRKLTDLEEQVLLQYILDLNAKGFPPRYCNVEDMANCILVDRDAPRVRPR
jgi:hypothetical protein